MPRNILKDLARDRAVEIERACRIQDRIEAHIRGGAERERASLNEWNGRVVYSGFTLVHEDADRTIWGDKVYPQTSAKDNA